MTTVIYDPGNYRMEINGHAGFDDPGKDIVCAGISALSYALIESAYNYSQYNSSVYMEQEQALIRVESNPDPEYADRCKAVYDTIYTGLQLIAEMEPEYISVTGGNNGNH